MRAVRGALSEVRKQSAGRIMLRVRDIREGVTERGASRYPEDREHSMKVAGHGPMGKEQPIADLLVGQP